MDKSLRNQVQIRANHRCEYCHLPQYAVDATFHIDHIIAQQHIDGDLIDPNGLAFACDRCNLYKGTNLSSVDPDTLEIVPLFNPRRDHWPEHFCFQGSTIFGLSPTGRATVRLLNMNARHRLEIRQLLSLEGVELS